MKITDIVNITSLNEAGSWQDLYAANQSTISDPNKIQIGQKINLPGGGTYTVQKGDTLSKIARQQSGGAAQSGRGAKPSPTAAVAAAAKDAENLTPYSMTADVAGVTGLAAAAGQFLPKVGGTIAKVVPGLNTVYQGANALRRASWCCTCIGTSCCCCTGS
jgi:LysM repeat protein